MHKIGIAAPMANETNRPNIIRNVSSGVAYLN